MIGDSVALAQGQLTQVVQRWKDGDKWGAVHCLTAAQAIIGNAIRECVIPENFEQREELNDFDF